MESFYKEKIGTDPYLCYDAGVDEKVDFVACKMMDNNEIPGILTMNYVTLDGKTMFRYNTAGLKSLEEYLSGNYNGIQLLLYLKEIAQTASLMLSYMLEEEMICCDKSLIFIDEDNHIKLVYLPLTEKRDENSLSNLSRDIIGNSFVRRCVKSNMYSELLRFIENDPINTKEFAVLLEKITLNAVIVPAHNGNSLERPVVLEVGDRNADLIEAVILSERQRVKKDELNSTERKKNAGPVILSHGPESLVEDELNNESIEHTVRITRTEYDNKTHNLFDDELIKADHKSDNLPDDSFDRTMDEEGTVKLIAEKLPVLIRSNTQEKISVGTVIFRIGKSRYDNEYSIIDNPVISRHHAVIMKKRGKHYLKDIDSKNKTYINGNQLIPQQEYELFDNAIIRLANEEFLFMLE